MLSDRDIKAIRMDTYGPMSFDLWKVKMEKLSYFLGARVEDRVAIGIYDTVVKGKSTWVVTRALQDFVELGVRKFNGADMVKCMRPWLIAEREAKAKREKETEFVDAEQLKNRPNVPGYFKKAIRALGTGDRDLATRLMAEAHVEAYQDVPASERPAFLASCAPRYRAAIEAKDPDAAHRNVQYDGPEPF